MALEMQAVYEKGILKLPRPLPIAEGSTVHITVSTSGGAVQRLVGLVPYQGDLEELDRWLNDADEGGDERP